MSILRLLIREGNFIESIEIDAFLRESATATARITSNPVEYGADVNDHVIIQPMRFVMSGVVSNAASTVLDIPGIVQQALTGITKAQAAWSDLLELHAKRKRFTLVQGLKAYDNVVIETLTEEQTKTTANALYFTANLVEIILVGTEAPPTVGYADDDTSFKALPTTNTGVTQLA